MDSWYRSYWGQTWYANTFLVHKPIQIAQAIAGDREWNNVHDSGCNFTCLAMIVGLDPGYFASELGAAKLGGAKYFFADKQLPAKHLNGKFGGLVWEQNAPHRNRKSISLKDIWHPQLKRRVTISLDYVDLRSTSDWDKGKEFVSEIRQRENHVVCGPVEHSHLVAGMKGKDYFLWDPDESETCVEDNLAGLFTLRKLFENCPSKDIEFWEYRCTVT